MAILFSLDPLLIDTWVMGNRLDNPAKLFDSLVQLYIQTEENKENPAKYRRHRKPRTFIQQ